MPGSSLWDPPTPTAGRAFGSLRSSGSRRGELTDAEHLAGEARRRGLDVAAPPRAPRVSPHIVE